MDFTKSISLKTKIIKKNLGQFYTSNYSKILQNMSIPSNIKTIIEPFAGQGDLLNFIEDKSKYDIECYDLDPKQNYILKRDTLKNPPIFTDKFVLTNPPYLARNKNSNKEIFDKYNANDLYKCFIEELIINSPIGGIIIIPLNFWCSIRKSDINLRSRFLQKFHIIHMNIFEEQVFQDTSYTICSFQFQLKNTLNINQSITEEIPIIIYPVNSIINVKLNKDNKYTIGGEIYNLKQNPSISIDRLTTINQNNPNITNILVKCIDDSSNNRIKMTIVDNDKRYIDNTEKLSARSYATLVISPIISLDKQKILVENFNTFLNKKREEFNSLFLTNYRESKDIARKRISFTLVYEITNYLLNEMNHS